MTFQITKEPDGNQIRIHIEGDFYFNGLGELSQICEEIDLPIVIDLSNLKSYDDKVIEALKQLVMNNTKIVGGSPYLSLLIFGR